MRRAGKLSVRARGRWVIVAATVAVLIAVLAQQFMAAQFGRWLAGLWVGALELVLGILAPLFGGH